MQYHDRVAQPIMRGSTRRAHKTPEGERPSSERSHHLVTLQRSIGNAQVSRLLAQREELPEEEIQAKHDANAALATPEVGLEGGAISDALASRINAKRGGGGTMEAGVQARMEGAFGSDFSDVRVHTDSEADALNRSVSAKAFTTGSDIFFSQNASPSDTQLLAHELAHVVQQRAAPPSGGPMTVGPAGDQHESAADAAAGSVATGSAVSAAQREVDPATRDIAREELPEEEELPV